MCKMGLWSCNCCCVRYECYIRDNCGGAWLWMQAGRTVASGLMESRVQDRTGEPNSCYPRFSLKTPAWQIRPWLSHRAVRFSQGSCLRPRYTRLVDGPFCVLGNEIYSGDPRICRHMVAINAPVSLLAIAHCPTAWCVPACLFWVLFILQAVCLLPLSRQPRFTQQHELLCVEERPSSANTWLSLHVHSHLIMGETPGSESFQHVREAQWGKA